MQPWHHPRGRTCFGKPVPACSCLLPWHSLAPATPTCSLARAGGAGGSPGPAVALPPTGDGACFRISGPGRLRQIELHLRAALQTHLPVIFVLDCMLPPVLRQWHFADTGFPLIHSSLTCRGTTSKSLASSAHSVQWRSHMFVGRATHRRLTTTAQASHWSKRYIAKCRLFEAAPSRGSPTGPFGTSAVLR